MEKTIKELLNLPFVINASGKMTKLGVSKISDRVAIEMSQGGQSFFEMEKLYLEAGKILAAYFQSESAFITNSASSALALTVAALINKGQIKYVEHFHKYLNELKREIIMAKGHNINYGTTVEGMINLGGGVLVEAGSANECTIQHVESNIRDNTVALVYIKSHHCVQKNMLSIDEMQELATKHKLPLVVDAAAEEDFSLYNKYDLVIFSGAKALEGPSSGIIIGKKDYIKNLPIQNIGMGRAMKVDKTIVFGTIQAVKDWFDKEEIKNSLDTSNFIEELNKIKDLESYLVKDEAGRDIYRIEINVKTTSHIDAKTLANELKKGDVAIFTREYQTNMGKIQFDTRALTEQDLNTILYKIKFIMEK